MANNDSKFPDNIDNLMIFQDVRLTDKSSYDIFKALIKNHKYKEASEQLQSSGTDYYGASIYNMLNRRLRAIGQYLLEKEYDELKHILYQDTVPEERYKGMFWIS